VASVTGLTAPAVIKKDVRTMSDADRDAIRASEDPDALLELRLESLAANTVPWRRAVALAIGVVGILGGILIVNMASFAVTIVVLSTLLALFVLGYGIQTRARARAIRIAGWVGTINFRLQQLAARN